MSNIKNLLSQLAPYKRYVAASVSCQVLYAIFTVISIPLIIPFFKILFNQKSRTVDKPDSIFDGDQYLEFYFSRFISSYSKEEALLSICLIIILVFFLKNLFRYLSMYFINPARNGIVRGLRTQMYQSLLNLPQHELKNRKKGDIMTRFTSDAQEVELSILQVLEVFVKSPLVIIGSLLFMLFVSPNLTLFVLLLMVFTVFIIGTISRTLKRESKDLQASIADINTHIDESISGMGNIRSYDVQDTWRLRFEQYNGLFYDRIVKLLRRRDLASPLSEFLGIVVVAILLYYGSHKVFQNTFSPETFFAFIFAFYQIIEPSKSFSKAFYNYKKGLAAYERIDEFIHIKDPILNKKNTIKKEVNFGQKIEFKNVSFQYPDGDSNILKEINLSIKKGETVAIVGASGSGKSSLVSLLLKFYSPSEGDVLIDDLSLQDVNISEWRRKLAIVTQDSFVYHDSIFENIQFGRNHIDRNRVKACLKLAKLEKYENQLDLIAGQDGQRFSGGEKQRICIARALADNPEILLLDEPTSSLDPKAEKEVGLAIKEAMKGRTCIIIAHKYMTIKNADRIIVIENGRIVENGTHSSLIKIDGYYKKYLSLQTDVENN